jgi:hypothetical protein
MIILNFSENTINIEEHNKICLNQSSKKIDLHNENQSLTHEIDM